MSSVLVKSVFTVSLQYIVLYCILYNHTICDDITKQKITYYILLKFSIIIQSHNTPISKTFAIALANSWKKSFFFANDLIGDELSCVLHVI